MVTAQFKLNSGASTVDLPAVYILEDFLEDSEKYTDINWTRRKIQNAKWKVWEVRFGYLNVGEQTYLYFLKAEELPQFIYDTVTYDIEILEVQIRYQGGMIRVANILKET